MGGLRSASILLVAALALSACQTGRTTQPVTAPPADAVAVAAPTPPPPAPVASPTTTPPAAAPEIASLPPINDDPAQLMGLDRDGVSALLGQPDLIRREAPAEIWQYVGTGCVFDVVLYENGRHYAVSYLEARDNQAAILPPRPCLNGLLRARQAAPVS